MDLLRYLLFPLAIVYGCLVYVRNKLYDLNLFSSVSFPVKTIVVGNLSVGGTGKSPHIEYLVRLLRNDYKIATLSRGYGRKTKEFIIADGNTTSADIGDEPLQFKRKFADIIVAVDAKRVNGINEIIKSYPSTKVILLDDAFQHRAVKAGLSIVLTDYHKLFYTDYIMPMGTLRESKSGIARADIVIVTKCPAHITKDEMTRITNRINAYGILNVYFTYIRYESIVALNKINAMVVGAITKEYSILLIAGIANTEPLEKYVRDKFTDVITEYFPDHYNYSMNDLNRISDLFNSISSSKKIIITTEKDAMRLMDKGIKSATDALPIYYLPIEIDFIDSFKTLFNNQITDYVRTN
jgi:tetraacyldisaccharide 4'-kinase